LLVLLLTVMSSLAPAMNLNAPDPAALPSIDPVEAGRRICQAVSQPPGQADPAARDARRITDPAMVASVRELLRPDETPRTRAAQLRNERADLHIAFNQRTGSAVFVRSSNLLPRRQAAERLAGRGFAAGQLDPEALAACAMHEYRHLFGINDGYKEFRAVNRFHDNLGLTHVRLQQVHRSIPVWARETIVHLDAKDNVYLIAGDTLPIPQIDTEPTLTIAEALAVVEADFGPLGERTEAELVIYTDTMRIPRLCYAVAASRDLQRWQYFVDADTGRIIHKYNDVWNAAVQGSGTDLTGQSRNFTGWDHGQGTYFMIDSTRPWKTQDPAPPDSFGIGNVVIMDMMNGMPEGQFQMRYVTSTAANGGWDATGVTAAYHMKLICDYFSNTLGRASIDGQGMNAVCNIHLGSNYANAFWEPGLKMIFFGDGDGVMFSSLAGSLDVMAHEFQHGVTSHTANLEYQMQSGALNEGYSDFFGCMVDRDDWLMGEDTTLMAPLHHAEPAQPARRP